jgi:hypothetical protein
VTPLIPTYFILALVAIAGWGDAEDLFELACHMALVTETSLKTDVGEAIFAIEQHFSLLQAT